MDVWKEQLKLLDPTAVSARKDGTFSREDFKYDPTGDVYLCPA
jgi:hypothetical protein